MSQSRSIGLQTARLQSVAALALLVLGLALATDSFWTVDNGVNVLRQISVNLCLSIGMTLVILSGGIDLSVGSVLALSGAVAAGALKHGFDLAPMGVHVAVTPVGAVVTGDVLDCSVDGLATMQVRVGAKAA